MQYIFYVPEENEPIGDVYYPDERDAPMPVEPLVHCKDCKHYRDRINGCAEFGDESRGEFANVEPDGFCAWGERREA